MFSDLPPNLVGSPPAHSEVRMIKEAEKERRRREEERRRAIEADIRLKALQTQQLKKN